MNNKSLLDSIMDISSSMAKDLSKGPASFAVVGPATAALLSGGKSIKYKTSKKIHVHCKDEDKETIDKEFEMKKVSEEYFN